MKSSGPLSSINEELLCYHCGEPCDQEAISIADKNFCCEGCKTVFELLDENGLCDYYAIEHTPGITLRTGRLKGNFAYLDDAETVKQLIDFDDGRITHITFHIPQIHCASCLWLLENLYKLREGVKKSQVNFLKKQLSVTFLNEQLSVRELVELLASLGYEPELSLANLQKSESASGKTFYYKLGIAGFCFGNIMLLSFPEYLAGLNIERSFSRTFSYINLALALPVFFYSSSYYFSSALKGLKNKILNIDVPISLGILTLFTRSLYEIISQSGPGYLDSMAGLVFFLLIGKWFQNKTYEQLSFERDYQSYFPVSVLVKKGEHEESIPVTKLEIDDVILVRNNELVPADSYLLQGNANIDYSFVTGESQLVAVKHGDLIYAGGRQQGSLIELKVSRKTSQSYLTQLWENAAFTNNATESFTTVINKVSKYFTPVILLIATIAAIYWLPVHAGKALNVFTAVLIIACPCALALVTPFTLGNALRQLGRNKLYLKSTQVIENMFDLDSIVFDKTGTITYSANKEVVYEGDPLNKAEVAGVKSLSRHSSHPLSRQIFNSLEEVDLMEVQSFQETPGQGIAGVINGNLIKIGSNKFVSGKDELSENPATTQSMISVNGKIRGRFIFLNQYRKGFEEMIAALKPHYSLSLISGDGDAEKSKLLRYFEEEDLHFNQSPHHKLSYIGRLQQANQKVLMIGDGLNDAGALSKSDVGVSVSENTGNFSPACDAILDAQSFHKLPALLQYARKSMKVVKVAFGISFIYNILGISFAVQGLLTPLVAAILMPLSSITVVSFGTASTSWLAWKMNLLNDKSHQKEKPK